MQLSHYSNLSISNNIIEYYLGLGRAPGLRWASIWMLDSVHTTSEKPSLATSSVYFRAHSSHFTFFRLSNKLGIGGGKSIPNGFVRERLVWFLAYFSAVDNLLRTIFSSCTIQPRPKRNCFYITS